MPPADTLTREQIEQMEAGPEMDALVAERVMGWTWGPGPCLYEPESDRRAHPRSVYNLCPPYSTDIAAAWTVLEHITRSQVTLEDGDYTLDSLDRLGFRCCDDDSDGQHGQYRVALTRHDGPEDLHSVIATGDTAPLAISRAALLATL